MDVFFYKYGKIVFSDGVLNIGTGMEMTYTTLLTLLTAAICVILFVFGVGQLTARKKTVRHYLLAAILIITAINIILDMAFRTGFLHNYPCLLYINYPLEYLLGPPLYLFFISLVYKDHQFARWEKMLFIVPLMVFLFMLPYFLQSGSIKRVQIPWYNGWTGLPGYLYRTIDRGIEIWQFFCFALALIKLIPHFFRAQHRKNNRLQSILIYGFLWLFWTAWYALVVLLPMQQYYQETVLTGSLLALILFFFYIRNPDFLSHGLFSLHSTSSQTLLNGKSVQTVLDELEKLMLNEEAYVDEHLSLSDLASRLGIQAYRLSDLLNNELHTTFKQYVNQYRLRKACELLVNEKKSSILDIAFRSGFQSKSAFNNIFKQKTGMTPSFYRKHPERHSDLKGL